MGKTSPLTGTGKKARDSEYKAHKYFAEESVKEHKGNRRSKDAAMKRTEDIAKKGLPKYEKVNYKKSSLSDLTKDYERAGKGAKKIFDPIEKEARKNYERFAMPEIANQYGAESGSRSSALNQALQAGQVDLNDRLAANFAGIKANLANSLLQQRENSRQFGAQFQSGQNQFANNSQLQNLNAKLQANSTFTGRQTQPLGGGIQNSYNAPSNSGPNGYQQMAGSIVKGGLTALGGIFGGPPGAISANVAAGAVNNQMGLA